MSRHTITVTVDSISKIDLCTDGMGNRRMSAVLTLSTADLRNIALEILAEHLTPEQTDAVIATTKECA